MNTLKLEVNSLEISDQQKEIAGYDNSRYFDFNESFSTSLIIEPLGNYRNIEFSQVTSPFMLIITSDKLLNAQINGVEFTNTKVIVLNTAIESVQIANADVKHARVNINIWGIQ